MSKEIDKAIDKMMNEKYKEPGSDYADESERTLEGIYGDLEVDNMVDFIQDVYGEQGIKNLIRHHFTPYGEWGKKKKKK